MIGGERGFQGVFTPLNILNGGLNRNTRRLMNADKYSLERCKSYMNRIVDDSFRLDRKISLPTGTEKKLVPIGTRKRIF